MGNRKIEGRLRTSIVYNLRYITFFKDFERCGTLTTKLFIIDD